MCLFSKETKPTTAEEPIVVYKIYKKDTIENGYISPVRKAKVCISQGTVLEAQGEEDVEVVDTPDGKGAYVRGGYLHSYGDLRSTLSYFDYELFNLSFLLNQGDYQSFFLKLQYISMVYEKFVIMEMEVPTGVEYYKETCPFQNTSTIAAKELKYRRTVYNLGSVYNFAEFIYNLKPIYFSDDALKLLERYLKERYPNGHKPE